DMSHTKNAINPIEFGDIIRNEIERKLGFTVCVGISSTKVLAKMATDLRKPNFTTTLFPHEIEKMWALPVGQLFMVGKKTEQRLKTMGIYTIGDLAHSDVETLKFFLKKKANKYMIMQME
ncbi:MAG: DNA polymerase IV, partial [Lachnospirales bacterium]